MRKLLDLLPLGPKVCPRETSEGLGSAALVRCVRNCSGPNYVDYYSPDPDGGKPVLDRQAYCGTENTIVIPDGEVVNVVASFPEHNRVWLTVAREGLGQKVLEISNFLDEPDRIPAGIRVVRPDGMPAISQ